MSIPEPQQQMKGVSGRRRAIEHDVAESRERKEEPIVEARDEPVLLLVLDRDALTAIRESDVTVQPAYEWLLAVPEHT